VCFYFALNGLNPTFFEFIATSLLQYSACNVEAQAEVPLEKVWQHWSAPEHIIQWNSASPDWHTPKAENDLRTGGSFYSRMETRDGSFGFDFRGTYYEVKLYKRIAYCLSRK
jgi:uncharacterized protein YndB with AHSA1/START domain